MHTSRIERALFLLGTMVVLMACRGFAQTAPATPLSPPAGESTLGPKVSCADLRALTGYEFTVESAILIPANGDVPEYCQVRGQIMPEIRFEVSLPATWNRRFYM